jgi:hypothetical protein
MHHAEIWRSWSSRAHPSNRNLKVLPAQVFMVEINMSLFLCAWRWGTVWRGFRFRAEGLGFRPGCVHNPRVKIYLSCIALLNITPCHHKYSVCQIVPCSQTLNPMIVHQIHGDTSWAARAATIKGRGWVRRWNRGAKGEECRREWCSLELIFKSKSFNSKLNIWRSLLVLKNQSFKVKGV